MGIRNIFRLKITALLLVLVIGLLSFGCQPVNRGDSGKIPSSGEETIATPPSGEEMIVVKDSLGRDVRVPAQVERIGCLYAFTGHVVAMLGQGQKIVAVVNGLKRDHLLNELVPAIADALVPSSDSTINIEELIKARPDVIFINGQTALNEGETAKLDKSGIPYLVVDFNNISEQQYAIEMVGKAIGAEERARAYNKFYQDCIDRVEKAVSDIPDNDRVKIYHSVNEASRTDINDTLPADWMSRTGVINVSVNENLKMTDGKYYANLEQIYLWDPDLIMVNEPGVVKYILDSGQWSGLRAVQNKAVYQMPIGISRWGHPGSMETPLAILWAAKTAYPDRFADLNIVLESQQFYKRFFNLELSADDIAKVLKAEGMRKAKSGQEN